VSSNLAKEETSVVKDRNNYRADSHGQVFRQARRGPTNAYPETTGLRREDQTRRLLPNSRALLPPDMSSNLAEKARLGKKDRGNSQAVSLVQASRPPLPSSPAPDSKKVKNKVLR